MNVPQPEAKQRADLTFKFNQDLGRHGWLRLTPAYSVKIVESIMSKIDKHVRVIDPFCGTATTPLCGAYHGHDVTALDINPFLVWLGDVKTNIYQESTFSDVLNTAKSLLDFSVSEDGNDVPPIYNINRWWNPEVLRFLSQLKKSIERFYPRRTPEKDLLLIAFCRTLIKLSNAAFNHQSMSFKSKRSNQLSLLEHETNFQNTFLAELAFILNTAKDNPPRRCTIILGDSKQVASKVDGKFDLLVTSPPYPNRISYIRELRPYMYWLGYLNEAKQAGELDSITIGGTWGVATSRLSNWERSPDGFYPEYFENLLAKIANRENRSGQILANYIAKYFEDIWTHLKSVVEILNSNARVHYIIGNSVFYDVLVPVERIYRDMFTELGFKEVQISTIRKRNSKKALFEFDVNGVKI
jgi:hypothetical protein